MVNKEKIQILVVALQTLGTIPIEMKHSPVAADVFTSIMRVVSALGEEQKLEEAESNTKIVEQAIADAEVNGVEKHVDV